MAKPKRQRYIDWEHLRTIYLNTDIDLYELSWEFSQNDEHPVWDTLRKRASSEGWKVARSEKNAKAILQARGTGTLDIEVDGELEKSRNKLIDAQLKIQRHVEVADSFLRLYSDLMPRVEQAFRTIDLSILEDDPNALATFTKTMQTIAKDAIEIERKVIGLADIKIDLLAKSESKSTSNITIDYSKLSDKELTDLYVDAIKINS